MTEQTRELRLTMRLSNNRIRKRREELGFATVPPAARAAGVSLQTWYRLEALSKSPLTSRTGRAEWRPTAVKIADFLRVTPEWLWPDQVLAVVQPKVVEEVDAADLRPALVAAQVYPALPAPDEELNGRETQAALAKWIDCIPTGEAKLLRLRFGLDDGVERTLQEIGDQLGLSRNWIRLRIERALGRLRVEAEKEWKKDRANEPTIHHCRCGWVPARVYQLAAGQNYACPKCLGRIVAASRSA